MQLDVPADFQNRLKTTLARLEAGLRHTLDLGPKVRGTSCRFDQETYRRLSYAFRYRQYSRGIMHCFEKVEELVRPEDLRRASLALSQERRGTRPWAIQVVMYQREMNELERVAQVSKMTPSAVLEACTYLYLRTCAE